MDRSIVRCNFPGVKDWLVREKRGILRSKLDISLLKIDRF